MKNCELKFDLEDVSQRFAPPLRQKIEHSVGLIRKAERLALAYDTENGYYNTFSGGKDSQCLYHLVQIAGVKHKTHMALTSVDPPEVIRFVKAEYPDVELIKPRDSIYNIAVKKKILPTMRVRWCCAEYKEGQGAGKVTLIGIRHAESSRRALRNEVEVSGRKYSGTLEGLDEFRERRRKKSKGVNITNADSERTLGCIHGKESLLISPIIDWSDDDVWTFLNTLGVKHCELYDQGFSRIGCIGCPMSTLKHKQMETERWPHVRRNWIRAIKKMILLGGGWKGRNYGIQIPLQQSRLIHQSQSHPLMAELSTVNPNCGGSACSSSDGLTEEQLNEIAENIYDWWVSRKSYQQWYAEKFIQQKIVFDEDITE